MKALYKAYFFVFLMFFSISGSNLFAQFSPPAGYAGSNAIYKDSSLFVGWATACSIQRGLIQINNPSLGEATYGNANDAVGPSDIFAVSLGDSGSALLQFEYPLKDGVGPDFAVFENGFDDYFLELAHVEVSSDGINFVRFPSVSLTQTDFQIATFGLLAAEKINNLAGKFKSNYGVPFDLADLDQNEIIDLQHITHIRIIDVIGTIDSAWSSKDAENRIINDPWPTPFPSSGFDLEAVGVIHDKRNLGFNDLNDNSFKVFPNPFEDRITITLYNKECLGVEVFNAIGKLVYQQTNLNMAKDIDLQHLTSGIYFLTLYTNDGIVSKKIVKE